MAGFSRDIANSQKKWQGTPNGDILTDHAAEYIAGISFEGGADTSGFTLQGFVKVHHPLSLYVLYVTLLTDTRQ